jgi:hypothetical protein
MVVEAMTSQGDTPSRATLPDGQPLLAARDNEFASQIFTIRDTHGLFLSLAEMLIMPANRGRHG